MKRVPRPWYEALAPIVGLGLFAGLLGTATAVRTYAPGLSPWFAIVCLISLVAVLTWAAAQRRTLTRRVALAGSLLPLTVTSTHPVPSRLPGRLTVTKHGMAWTPFSPWRRRHAVALPWSSVRSVTCCLVVDTADSENIWFGVSQASVVRLALEECGMVWHRHPWDREVPDVALWAGEEPNWGLVSDIDRIEP